MIAIFDCDGTLNTGRFLYDESGKRYKEFGPDDALALQTLSKFMRVHIISGDKRGWAINEKRVADMGFVLEYAPSQERREWIRTLCDEFIFMGDSFTDIPSARDAMVSYCPADADARLKKEVTVVCQCAAGMRAVAEAVFDIFEKFKLPIEELLR